jgi:hypothetical protein
MDAAVRHNGRIVGKMEGRTFVRVVDPERHMLRSPAAWSHDNALLERLERAGCAAIRIDARNGSGVWYAPLTVIRAKGFAVNRAGWPPQTALVLSEWATVEVRQATAADVAAMMTAIEAAG